MIYKNQTPNQTKNQNQIKDETKSGIKNQIKDETKSGIKNEIKAHLISSGFKLNPKEIKKTKEYWLERGLGFIYEPHLMNIHKSTNDLLCSEKLDVRFKEFKKAFESEETEFVWSLRGGYGAHQLLPLLSKVSFAKKKTYMGFSDGTSIHYYINMHLNWPSLHSPHPNTFHKKMHSPEIESYLSRVFQNEEQTFEFHDLKVLNGEFSNILEAKLLGGNLTTLVSLLGTPFYKGAEGKILFLEEIEEPAYKVIRHLHHMDQAGFFKNVKALVFGHMTHSDENQEALIYQCVKDWAKSQKTPVLWGLNAGHKHKENNPLWLFKNTKLYLDENPHLINNV